MPSHLAPAVPRAAPLATASRSVALALAALALPSCSGGGGTGAGPGAGDTQAPTIAWKAIPALQTGLPVLLEVEASDAQGLERVEIALDGQPLASLQTAPFEFEFLPNAVPGTALALTATAFDAAGNRSSAAAAPVVQLGGSPEVVLAGGLEAAPAVQRFAYSADGGPWSEPTLVGSLDGQTVAAAAGQVGHFPAAGGGLLEWNSAMDLGLVDRRGVLLALALRDAQGQWRCSEPIAVDVLNATLIATYRQRLFPDAEDILDHGSPYLAKILPSLVIDSLPSGVVRKRFVFDSPHVPELGAPDNVCAGCTSWKKDVWTDIECSLYLPAGAAPTEFLLMNVLGGEATLWSPDFALLFPEFQDGSIPGVGTPSQAKQASFEASVLATVEELGIGVIVGDFLQAGGSVPGSVAGVALCSFDQALASGEPRWNAWVAAAAAMLRALTATEIVQGAAPGSLRFALQGSSRFGWASGFAVAADPRVLGAYLHVSAGIGEWDLLGETAVAHFTPGLQTNWDGALAGLWAAGYPLYFPLNLDGFALIEELEDTGVWHQTSDPAVQIALALLQGKQIHQQEASADWNFDLRLRGQWFDDTLRRRYPQGSVRMHYTANADHGSSGPQDFLNLRSFAAGVFRGRSRSDVEAEAILLPSGQVLVRARVENPAPAQLEIAAVRLRFGVDDDGDWRHIGLPAPALGSPCLDPLTGQPQVCFGQGNLFSNRSFQSVPLFPSGVPGEYLGSLDLGLVGPPQDRFTALYVEVEDRLLPGGLPGVAGPNRYFHSSRFFFFEKP
jgi:hypothetical protein